MGKNGARNVGTLSILAIGVFGVFTSVHSFQSQDQIFIYCEKNLLFQRGNKFG